MICISRLFWFWNIPVFLVVLTAILALYLRGQMPISVGIILIIPLLFFLVFGRWQGGGVFWWVRDLFRIGFPLVSLATLAILYGGGSSKDTLLVFLLLLLLGFALLGLYFIFFGLFPSRTNSHLFDFFAILSALALILPLMLEGYLPFNFGLGILILIVFLIALGRGKGKGVGWSVRTLLMRFGLPIVGLLLLFKDQIAIIPGSIIQGVAILFLFLVCFYLIFGYHPHR